MDRSKPLLLSLLLLLSGTAAQDFLWPVDLGRMLSSNFGEFRPRRFHPGIDIKTNGTVGHELAAVDDGYIWRVKVSSNGYGRALYLKLATGQTALYAHLDRFFPLIDDLVRLEQQRQNSYTVERYFPPDQFPVKKGDVVGYSGESGRASGPHLHFELRDSDNRPLNPLLHGFELEDRLPPLPRELAVVPLSTDAMINGSPLPQIFPLFSSGPREYEFPDTLHVFGTVGLEISVVDRVPGVSNELNIHGAVLSVDGVDRYRIEFDQFGFEKSHLIEIERDNSFRRLNDGEFHRLFTLQSGPQPDFVKTENGSRLALRPGFHRVNIKLFDPARNVVRIHGVLYQAPPIRIQATVLDRSDRLLRVSLEPTGSPFPLQDMVCYSFNRRGYVEEKIVPVASRKEDNRLVVDLPGSRTRHRILQFIGMDRMGAVSMPFHLPMGIRESDPASVEADLSIRHLETTVLVQVEYDRYLPVTPETVLRGPGIDEPIDMVQIRPNTFLSPPLPPRRFAGTREVVVTLRGSPEREIRYSFKPKLGSQAATSAAVSPDGKCSLQALSSTFYDSSLFWIENVENPVPVRGGQTVGGTYQLQPFDRPLKDSARVAIALPQSVEDPSGLGIFYYDNRKGWTYLPSRFSRSRLGGMFFTSVYSLESVAILKDTRMPVIKDIYPGHGGRYEAEDVRVLSAVVDDELAGIGDDRAIEMTLDDTPVLFEYQPIKKSVTFRLDEPLVPGRHKLVITATDQVGNSSTEVAIFSIGAQD
ncbi:MAG: M23 family metallopeptidase [Fidelibacterota bacterium]